ncbi:MAG: hypothetical protein NZT61_00520 [Deltaproteobacteria bacterium]|nr:hypothetical protein [Deltaproteobacteria bacterium]
MFPSNRGSVLLVSFATWFFCAILFFLLVITPLWILAVTREIGKLHEFIHLNLAANYPNPENIVDGLKNLLEAMGQQGLGDANSPFRPRLSQIRNISVFFRTNNDQINGMLSGQIHSIPFTREGTQTDEFQLCFYSDPSNLNDEHTNCGPRELDEKYQSLIRDSSNYISNPIVVGITYKPLIFGFLEDIFGTNKTSVQVYYPKFANVPTSTEAPVLNIDTFANYVLPTTLNTGVLSDANQRCFSHVFLYPSNFIFNLLVLLKTFFNFDDIVFRKYVTTPLGLSFVLKIQDMGADTYIRTNNDPMPFVDVEFEPSQGVVVYQNSNSGGNSTFEDLEISLQNAPSGHTFVLSDCFNRVLFDRNFHTLSLYHGEVFEQVTGVPPETELVTNQTPNKVEFSKFMLSFLAPSVKFWGDMNIFNDVRINTPDSMAIQTLIYNLLDGSLQAITDQVSNPPGDAITLSFLFNINPPYTSQYLINMSGGSSFSPSIFFNLNYFFNFQGQAQTGNLKSASYKTVSFNIPQEPPSPDQNNNLATNILRTMISDDFRNSLLNCYEHFQNCGPQASNQVSWLENFRETTERAFAQLAMAVFKHLTVLQK